MHDGAGNRTSVAYPSGVDLGTTFDPLHRAVARGPQNPGTGISPQVTYGYHGFGLEATKAFGNGITGTTSFDGARRAVATAFVFPLGGNQLFSESTAWSPRSLKTAQAYSHQNGRGRLMAYDGAGRLLQQALVPDPLAQVSNNTAPASSVLDSAGTATRFAYDAAQNLVSREERDQGVETTVSLPVDASGRNRPASVNGKTLEYDLNGNLTRKGDQRYKYDFRNRLTQVTDPGGTEIAQYAYDADNRRVQRLVGGATIETVWDGLQALEHYRNGQLETRMTYGNGLDEVIALEVDLDGDGSLEPPLTPIYDASGNLVLLTDESGKPVERITYSPYGDRTIRVDVTPPAVEQLRVVGDELWLEVSEEVLADSLATAFAVGQIRLVEDATSTELTLLSAEQPVKTGRQAGRRIVLTLDTPPAAATAVTLTIEPAALVDFFLNQPAADFTASFAWPGADAVLVDTAPPVLHEVSQREGHLEIELSETIDPSTFAAGLLIDGAPAAWISDANGYRLRMNDPLTDGSHTIAITTALEDLDGQALTEAYSETITISSATPVQLHYVIPDERITPTSTTGNTLAFHGRPVDEETGFLYFRNRYYDPELGRFVSADPLGYVDGPSQYIFSGYDPVNMGDPLGLACPSCRWTSGNPPVPRPLKPEEIPYFGPGPLRQTHNALNEAASDRNRPWAERLRDSLSASVVLPFAVLEDFGRGYLNYPRVVAEHRRESEQTSSRYWQLLEAGISSREAHARLETEGYDTSLLVLGPGLGMAPMGPGKKGRLTPRRTRVVEPEVSRGGEKVYRGMRDAEGVPMIGPSARTLGVRPSTDIPVDTKGMVHPGTGGMSVAPSPHSLPSHRRPPQFGGTGKDPVWGISTGDLGTDLRYVPDSVNHGTIQPGRSMSLESFQDALCATVECWFKQ